MVKITILPTDRGSQGWRTLWFCSPKIIRLLQYSWNCGFWTRKSVAFPVSWTRGVRHWSSPGQPQWSTRRSARFNAFIEKQASPTIQHLRWKLKGNERSIRQKTKTTTVLHAGKETKKELRGIQARLTSDLDSGVKDSKSPTVETTPRVLK